MPTIINRGKEMLRISPKDSKKIEFSTNQGRSWAVRYTKDNPLVIGEIEGIHQFADMFSRDTHIIWGISERNDNQEAVVAQIVASNLQKK